MKVAIYCRVSTTSQTMDPQVRELEEYAAKQGYEIAHRFSDVMSGAKTTRSGLAGMMALVRAKEIDAVLIVKIDRLARSLTHFAQLIDSFRKSGVALIVTSQNIDTSSSNPAGRMMMNMLGVIADFEREIISERTKAGLAVVKAGGKQLGHPSKVMPGNAKEIVEAWHQRTGGVGLRELRKLLGGCAISTAATYARRFGPVG
jgi:putative DNA-invertase from lambdoid prophage Rac